MNPDNVVFEVTERHPIKDFSLFNRSLKHYRDQGFMVAVDDVGDGFSTIRSIAELRPDYIKIDISLVRGIHKDRVKTALMETLVTFAEKIGSEIIAEGIEDDAELVSLVNSGVHYGQGYFFGKPAYPKQITTEEAYLKTLRFINNGRQQILKNAFPIGDIVDETIAVDGHVPVKDVKALLKKTRKCPVLSLLNTINPVVLSCASIWISILEKNTDMHYIMKSPFPESWTKCRLLWITKLRLSLYPKLP